MTIIDCNNLACPEPVLKTKNALDSIEEGVITVIVDNLAAKENVSRFAKAQGCTVSAKAAGEGWELTIAKGYSCELPEMMPEGAPGVAKLPTAILILSDKMGADPKLGEVLMRAFLSTLSKASLPPAKVLFMNSGVLLTAAGSEAIEDIQALVDQGVEVLSCGTCLDFFDKKDALKVGTVTNMFDTVETLTDGYRVTTIR
ncbi:MAG: sulfurtransferase-like selenium metabolism protein YedF [Deltaproteobacteria bacterium]|nr:MAG: sulfurtransferase-like selenium metabolism protein YedF [Deltaproteobacteria bacterium]